MCLVTVLPFSSINTNGEEKDLPMHFARFLIDLARLRTPNENKAKNRTGANDDD